MIKNDRWMKFFIIRIFDLIRSVNSHMDTFDCCLFNLNFFFISSSFRRIDKSVYFHIGNHFRLFEFLQENATFSLHKPSRCQTKCFRDKTLLKWNTIMVVKDKNYSPNHKRNDFHRCTEKTNSTHLRNTITIGHMIQISDDHSRDGNDYGETLRRSRHRSRNKTKCSSLSTSDDKNSLCSSNSRRFYIFDDEDHQRQIKHFFIIRYERKVLERKIETIDFLVFDIFSRPKFFGKEKNLKKKKEERTPFVTNRFVFVDEEGEKKREEFDSSKTIFPQISFQIVKTKFIYRSRRRIRLFFRPIRFVLKDEIFDRFVHFSRLSSDDQIRPIFIYFLFLLVEFHICFPMSSYKGGRDHHDGSFSLLFSK